MDSRALLVMFTAEILRLTPFLPQRHYALLSLTMKANAISMLALLCLCAKTYALSYGDTVPSPSGRHNAIYLGSEVRIDDNPVKVLTIIAMNWTGDGNTLVIVEHLAGGSQLALVHLVDSKWKRFEIEPPLNAYDDISVVELTVHKNSVGVKYKLTQHNDQDFRFYVCSFDLDPATQTRSNEVTKKLTAVKYEKLPRLTKQSSIKRSY
jgi:hypothetical protein